MTLHDPTDGPAGIDVEFDPPTPPPWDGAKIARAFHGNYHRFVATLRGLDVTTRAQWAIAYAEYLAPLNRTGTPLTAEHVTQVWHRAMDAAAAR